MNLLDLPTEIILQILEHLDDGEARPSKPVASKRGFQYHVRKSDPSSLLTSCLVSRRLNALTEPLLYRNLRIIIRKFSRCNGRPLPSNFDLLQAALDLNHRRYTFIESVDLDLTGVRLVDSPGHDIVMKLIEKSTRIKTISLKCDDMLLTYDLTLAQALFLKRFRCVDMKATDVDVVTTSGLSQEPQSLFLRNNRNRDPGYWSDNWCKKFIFLAGAKDFP